MKTEAESKEKHGVWETIPELTITSPYVDSRVDSIHLPWATLCQSIPLTRVDFIPGQGLWIWPQCDTNAYTYRTVIMQPSILVCRRVYILNLFVI
jgi:hypothetical protein